MGFDIGFRYNSVRGTNSYFVFWGSLGKDYGFAQFTKTTFLTYTGILRFFVTFYINMSGDRNDTSVCVREILRKINSWCLLYNISHSVFTFTNWEILRGKIVFLKEEIFSLLIMGHHFILSYIYVILLIMAIIHGRFLLLSIAKSLTTKPGLRLLSSTLTIHKAKEKVNKSTLELIFIFLNK